MKSSKLKIAFFTDILTKDTDGVTHTIFNIIKRIPKDDFDFLFITPKPPTPITGVDWPIFYCPAIRFPLYPDYQMAVPFFSKSLKKCVDEFAPDIIHFTSPSLLGYWAVKYGKRNNIPVTNIYHTHFPSYLEYYVPRFLVSTANFLVLKVLKAMYRPCMATFVPSTPMRDFLLEQGVAADKIFLLGRGIELDRFSPNFRTSEIEPFNKKAPVLLFVSRLVFEKEVKTLEQVYHRMQQIRPDVQFVLVGDGPAAAYLKKHMPKAIFTGKLTGKQLSVFYASSDIFLFPSVTETFGNVVLEAQASGLPVIAAKAGGPVDIVQDGKTGFLVAPKNADEFVEKILLLLNDKNKLSQFSQAAAESAKSRSWDDIVNQLFQKYKQLAG